MNHAQCWCGSSCGASLPSSMVPSLPGVLVGIFLVSACSYQRGRRATRKLQKCGCRGRLPRICCSATAQDAKAEVAWRRAHVSPDGTHHVGACGNALYAHRFDKVLPFHDPGLAPVQSGATAWHIGVCGVAAYDRRFSRTFGFYGGRSAVVDAAGRAWHIDASGQDVYLERYAWCGNFQEGRCVVRTHDDRYMHLTESGIPLTSTCQRWRYAGDFREGVAVVHDDTHRATHIDPDGALLHGQYFLDLDVFHKGFARAQDRHGWMHVSTSGEPIYDRRFQAVEPFYNGQARVHRFDGGVEVIDEQCNTILEVRPASAQRGDMFEKLSADLVGFWRTQALHVATSIGVFEAMPDSLDCIAAKIGMPVSSLKRLLRALGELGTVALGADGMWRLTERGALLRADHPLSLADAAWEYGEHMTEAWRRLPRMLRNPEEPPPDVFKHVAADPERCRRHHRMLRSYARHDYSEVARKIDLRDGDVVVDAGGGVGVLTTEILRQHPGVDAILFDLPEVVLKNEVPEELRDRLVLCGADLQADWQASVQRQVNTVIFARVLHDFNDDLAIQIFVNAKQVLKPKGLIQIIEFLLPEDDFNGGLCDLHLLAVTGGKERTQSNFEELIRASGLTFVGRRDLPALPSLLIAELND